MTSRMLVVALALLAVGQGPSSAADVALDAAQVCPALIGTAVPSAPIRRVDGTSTDLSAALAGQPTILVFYRGGWCPFCSTQLGELQEAHPQLLALGYQLLAISPDRPEKLGESIGKHKLDYTLISDSRMEAARALGIAFQVDDATLARYHEYGIDLEADSGETHHQLPVPAAFVVDTQSVVRFAYINPDYKIRVDAEVLLAAARAAMK